MTRNKKLTFEERDQLTAEEQKIIFKLNGASPADKDQILFELERKMTNGNTLRNDSTGNGIV